MTKIELFLDEALVDFYRKIGRQADIPVQQVMADALFKLAGELSLNALHQKQTQPK